MVELKGKHVHMHIYIYGIKYVVSERVELTVTAPLGWHLQT